MSPLRYLLARTRLGLTLGRELARGGEGAVYEVQHSAELVVKLYHPGKTPPPGKLERMVANPPDDPTAANGHCSIAWPCDLLHDAAGQTVGYLMPKISGGVPLHRLYNPRSRSEKAFDFHWHRLHVAALNLASAVAAIHAKGYCLGDLNESNILVQPTALITVVDTDSFQVPNPPGSVFLCPVGKPDYTAPEIQGQDFHTFRRNEEHDRFALAVLLFLVLQEGSHPFRGLGPPPELGERIRGGLFPFAVGSKASPPPFALFNELAPPLQGLFRAAFGSGHADPGQRPSAREWRRTLDEARKELIECRANPHHHYHRDQTRCTWCARTRDLGGLDSFPNTTPGRRRPSPSPTQASRPAPPPVAPPPAPAQVPSPAPQATPPLRPRRRVVKIAGGFTVLALLVVGATFGLDLYEQWTTSPAHLLGLARAALERGDEAAADQALEQVAVAAPEQVAEFSHDRAEMYRALARQAKTGGGDLFVLAKAVRWDARAEAAAKKAAATAPRHGPVGTIEQEMVIIPGGTFQMGCSPGDSLCGDNEKPAHEVKVPAFRMGRYEVTQAQWQAVMGENPSHLKDDERPVDFVSWFDAQEFLKRLNAKGRGKPYRLPTEAEWEYAARAGQPTRYPWGKRLGKGNANCQGCGSQWDVKKLARGESPETAPVGSFKSNAFGLYDTVGNRSELVQDCYHRDYTGAPTDGTAWLVDCRKSQSFTGGGVTRGGSNGDPAKWLGVSHRYPGGTHNLYNGLRLAQDL